MVASERDHRYPVSGSGSVVCSDRPTVASGEQCMEPVIGKSACDMVVGSFAATIHGLPDDEPVRFPSLVEPDIYRPLHPDRYPHPYSGSDRGIATVADLRAWIDQYRTASRTW